MKKISFCINTSRNEKNYISLLLTSMENNFSSFDHEIIIFIDSDNQNTYKFLKERDSKFKDIRILKNKLDVPIGYAPNINIMFELAKHDIVSMIQSDMVVCKNYDKEILRHLKDDNTIISATRVEPSLHPQSPEKYTMDFGLNPDEFDFDSFNSFVSNNTDLEKTTYYWFAPFTLYKKQWLDIGGHDTLFRRSREDTDILMRFRLKGLNIIQTWSALVYHFTCVSSRGQDWFKEENQDRTQLQEVADNIEMGKFMRKWKNIHHTAEPIEDYSKHYLYRCSLLLRNCSSQLVERIINISLFFDRVYVDDIETLNLIHQKMRENDIPANKLFGYTEDQWDLYSKNYITCDYKDIFKDIKDYSEDDISVTTNITDITTTKTHSSRVSFLQKINDIIHYQVDSNGEFEYDVFKVVVNNKNNVIEDNIYTNNPEWDLDLILEDTI